MRSYNGYYWSNWSIPVPLSKHHVLDPQCTGLPELSTTQRPLVSSSPAVTVTVTPGNSCTMTSLRMSDMTILLNSSITGSRPAFLCVWSHSCLCGSAIHYRTPMSCHGDIVPSLSQKKSVSCKLQSEPNALPDTTSD